jgi:hypothetical protein
MALRRGIPLAPLPSRHGSTEQSRSAQEDIMARRSKTSGEPRIGRKDLQDPDRDVRSPRKGTVEPEADRSDREAGAGRPVQLDEEGRSRPLGADSPRPVDAAPAPK